MSYNSPFTGQVIQPTDVSYRNVVLIADVQLEWPINGTTTTDFVARINDVTPATAGLSIWMPPADQTSTGNDAFLRNLGSVAFTVKDYAGVNTITTVAPGEAQYIYITSNTNNQGTWGVIGMGIGSSGTSAGALAGLGLVATGTTLSQSHPIQSIVAGSTLSATQRAQTLVWTGGVGTATLPASTTLGNNWFTLFKNNSTGSFTFSTTGSELLDGSTTKVFNPGESAFILCTGTGYITVGYGVSTQFSWTVLTKPVTAGTYVLTANEAANNISTFTGVLTNNVFIQYPPVVNLYVVSNQTTAGGFALTVGTGIVGSASATIPPSGQATLYCDGTNFYNANTYQAGATSLQLIDGSASGPSLQFALETNTGVYRPGAGRFGISVLGTLRVDVSATGLAVTGTGTFTGGISGGTF